MNSEIDDARVRQLRTGIVNVINEAINSNDETRISETLYALAQILAGIIVRVSGGDMQYGERLFLVVCQHTMDLIPEFEAIRVAKMGPPPPKGPIDINDIPSASDKVKH